MSEIEKRKNGGENEEELAKLIREEEKIVEVKNKILEWISKNKDDFYDYVKNRPSRDDDGLLPFEFNVIVFTNELEKEYNPRIVNDALKELAPKLKEIKKSLCQKK